LGWPINYKTSIKIAFTITYTFYAETHTPIIWTGKIRFGRVEISLDG